VKTVPLPQVTNAKISAAAALANSLAVDHALPAKLQRLISSRFRADFLGQRTKAL